MSIWDHPKFSRPSEAVGDWHDERTAFFEHEARPTEVRYLIEKLTLQLLRLEPGGDPRKLVYSGTSSARGHPCTIQLGLQAVREGQDPRYLYFLRVERVAPRRWEDESHFREQGELRFSRWCRRLRIVKSDEAWASPSPVSMTQTIREAIRAEEAASSAVEDPAPIAEMQRRVLDALRDGHDFRTANKEGGSRLFFDGLNYRRSDYGEEPNLNETYADNAGMLACLRRFYDWESQRDSYPHPKPELDIWTFIFSQLRPV